MIPETRPFLSNYKQLKIPIIDENGVPAWPELFPMEKIDEIRETVGPRYFSAQMMLEYINAESTRLDPGALKFYEAEFDARTGKLEEHRAQSADVRSYKFEDNLQLTTNNLSSLFALRSSLLVTGAAVYWDPSGGRSSGDNSVIVLIYRDDKNRRAFIHDLKYLGVTDSDMHPLATQCDHVLDFMQNHNQKKIAIEVNGMGNALPEILREVANKRGQPVIVQRITNTRRKETRILDGIEPLLTTGRLYAHERIKSTPLLAEMLGWVPNAANQNDDGLDAVAGALGLTAVPTRTLPTALRARTEFKI